MGSNTGASAKCGLGCQLARPDTVFKLERLKSKHVVTGYNQSINQLIDLVVYVLKRILLHPAANSRVVVTADHDQVR